MRRKAFLLPLTEAPADPNVMISLMSACEFARIAALLRSIMFLQLWSLARQWTNKLIIVLCTNIIFKCTFASMCKIQSQMCWNQNEHSRFKQTSGSKHLVTSNQIIACVFVQNLRHFVDLQELEPTCMDRFHYNFVSIFSKNNFVSSPLYFAFFLEYFAFFWSDWI